MSEKSWRRLYLDVTSQTVVIQCHECPHWQAVRFTREEAWRAGRDHEKRAHPGSRQATTALHWYTTRRDASSR